jgi:hypothetical protein
LQPRISAAAPILRSDKVVEAAALADTLGVNVHLTFRGTPYADVAAVQAALDYLGLRTMRDVAGETSAGGPHDVLAAKGRRFNFFAPSSGSRQLEADTLRSWLSAFAAAHPGAIVSIEGPNEINNWPVSWNGRSGMAGGAGYQRALHKALDADPRLAAIPLINLSLAGYNASTYAPLGNMSGVSDEGNAHIYFSNGIQPGAQFASALSWAQAVTPGHAMAVTETGYGTDTTSTLGVDQATQAKLTLNLILDAAKSGVAATYLYQLVDIALDPTDPFGKYGLFNGDWSPKLAATALHNFMDVIGTHHAGADALSAAPQFAISGLSNGSELTLHKADGSYDIVLWAEPKVWDQSTHSEVQAATQNVSVSLSQAVGGYTVYDPMSGDTAITSGGATSTINVDVSDHPIIIEVHGNAAAATP